MIEGHTGRETMGTVALAGGDAPTGAAAPMGAATLTGADSPTGAATPISVAKPTGATTTGSAIDRFGARWIGLLAATLIALYVCWRMVEPFVEVLLWATVLVIIFYPVHAHILRRARGPSTAAVMSCLLVVLVILAPLTLIALAITSEAVGAADALEAGINQMLAPDSRVRQTLGRWINLDEVLGGQWKGSVVDWVQGRSAAIAGGTFKVLGRVLGGLLKIFFVVFTMYYFFRDSGRIRAALHDVLPLEADQSHQIFERTREVIHGSLYGVVVIAAIQGTLGGLAFWFLGLPSPLLWGAVMFLLSMIPLIGSTIVWVPTALFLLATGYWFKGIFLIVWGAGVIAMVDNLLRPRLVGGRTRLHELIVFFSVLGGLQLFGILGLVVGPVVVALTLALLDVFRTAHLHKVPAPVGVLIGGEDGRGGDPERGADRQVEEPKDQRLEALHVEQPGDQRHEGEHVRQHAGPAAEQRPGAHGRQHDQ